MNKKQLYNLIELEKETQEQFQKLVPEIYKKAKQIFDFRKMGGMWCNFPRCHDKLDNSGDCENCISIDKDNIIIRWSEYHCDSDDYYNISFPTEYLFMLDEEWQGIEIVEKKKREKKQKEKKKKRDFEERERQREADIKEYERLKVKFNK